MLARATTAAAAAAIVLAGSAASAGAATSGPDAGSEPGAGFSIVETLFFFVGIPLALFAVIAVLVTVTSTARGPRYRPGLGWWAAPVWFNGPADPDTAIRQATGTTGGGGASARW